MKTFEVAEHLGISRSQVAKLRREGILPRPVGRRGVTLKESRKAYCDYLRGTKGQSARVLIDERERLDRLRADKIEFDLAVAKGEYLTIGQIAEWAQSVGDVINGAFERIRSGVRKQLSHLTPRQRQIIDRELANAAEDIARLGSPE